jgi:hypothetical protein
MQDQAPNYYPPQPVQQPMQPAHAQPYGAPQPHTDKSKIPDRKSVASKMVELVYVLMIILESILGLRFVFKLLGANPENILTSFLYQMTMVFTIPFEGLFRTPIQNNIAVSRYELEFTTLVAMAVYALIAFIVVKIIDIFR